MTNKSSVERFKKADIIPRLAVILVGLPLLVLVADWGKLPFMAVVSVLVLLGSREFYLMMEAKGYRPYKIIGMLCSVMICWYVYHGSVTLSLLLTMTMILIMTAELFRRDPAHSLAHIAVTLFGVLYVGWLGSHLILLRQLPIELGEIDYSAGATMVGLAAVVTWACDSGAYLFGISFGKKPLLPRISPKKTVEGGIGGLFSSALVGAVYCIFFIDFISPLEGGLLGLVGGVLGQVGDMVESLLKRDAGLKDTADILPGHGGILDRFDSLLFTAPFFYYYLHYFA
ncbi:MAG: phosphatidate cytidylyltransferase [bacterium]|nr:phosphatidate cytidylyltransferase [bacterium]MCP4799017.1 phosphatidate cytidylyltransferase [bacterium]